MSQDSGTKHVRVLESDGRVWGGGGGFRGRSSPPLGGRTFAGQIEAKEVALAQSKYKDKRGLRRGFPFPFQNVRLYVGLQHYIYIHMMLA